MSIRSYLDMLIKVSDADPNKFPTIASSIASNVKSIRRNVLEKIRDRSSGKFANTLNELIRLAEIVEVMSTNVQSEDKLTVFIALVSNFYLSIRKFAEVAKSKNIISDSEYNDISTYLNQIFNNMKSFADMEFKSGLNRTWSSFLKNMDDDDNPDSVVARIFSSLKKPLKEDKTLNSIYSSSSSDIKDSPSFLARQDIDSAFLDGDEFDEKSLKDMFPGIDEAKPVGDTDESPEDGESPEGKGSQSGIGSPTSTGSRGNPPLSEAVECSFGPNDVKGFAECISKLRRQIELARKYMREPGADRLYYQTYMKNIASKIRKLMREAQHGTYGLKILRFVQTPHAAYRDIVQDLLKNPDNVGALRQAFLGGSYIFGVDRPGILSDTIPAKDLRSYAGRIINEGITFEKTLLSLASAGVLVDPDGIIVDRERMKDLLRRSAYGEGFSDIARILVASAKQVPYLERRIEQLRSEIGQYADPYTGVINRYRNRYIDRNTGKVHYRSGEAIDELNAAIEKLRKLKYYGVTPDRVRKLLRALSRYQSFRYMSDNTPFMDLGKSKNWITGGLWSEEILDRAYKFVDKRYAKEPGPVSSEAHLDLQNYENRLNPLNYQESNGYHPVFIYWAVNRLRQQAAKQGDPRLVVRLNQVNKQLLERFPYLLNFGRTPEETIDRLREYRLRVLDELALDIPDDQRDAFIDNYITKRAEFAVLGSLMIGKEKGFGIDHIIQSLRDWISKYESWIKAKSIPGAEPLNRYNIRNMTNLLEKMKRSLAYAEKIKAYGERRFINDLLAKTGSPSLFQELRRRLAEMEHMQLRIIKDLNPDQLRRFKQITSSIDTAISQLSSLNQSGIMDEVTNQVQRAFIERVMPRDQYSYVMGLIGSYKDTGDPYADMFKSIWGSKYDVGYDTGWTKDLGPFYPNFDEWDMLPYKGQQEPVPPPQPPEQPSAPQPQPTSWLGHPSSPTQPTGSSFVQNQSQLPNSEFNPFGSKNMRGFLDGLWS